jgi:hypothetical protein
MHVTKRTSWTSAQQAVLFSTLIRRQGGHLPGMVFNCPVNGNVICSESCTAINSDIYSASFTEAINSIAIAYRDAGFTHC